MGADAETSAESLTRSVRIGPRGSLLPWLEADTVLLILAVGVGLGAGLMAVFFKHLIDWVTLAAQWFRAATSPGLWLGAAGLVLVAVLGALLVGPLTHFLAPEAKGHGVPEVMAAVALRGGRLRARVPLVKAVASALTIGTGGSAGREGPIVQIGAAIGSALAQWFRLPDERIKTLVGCGAAAGIAATFNAPIAGAIFAVEVILGDFALAPFIPIVIASAVGAVTAWAFLGNTPAFVVPQYELVSYTELVFYALLGLVAALVGQLYVRVLYGLEDGFERLRRVPAWVKPAIGAVGFGLIGMVLPQTLGAGYGPMGAALHAEIGLGVAALLAFAKILTTSLTLGSGGSGGVFAPGLYIGTMTGTALGTVFHGLYPAMTASPGAYALVGMGAVFAAATQAPITAILIIFEITRDYRIIVPLMVACVLSTLVSNRLRKETIYTLKLARRGITLRAGRDEAVLSSVTVDEVMTRSVDSIGPDQRVGELVQLMQRTRHNGFPVIDAAGRLLGIVTLQDVRSTPLEGRLDRKVSEIMTANPVVTEPAEPLSTVMAKLTRHGIGRLPVVEPGNPTRLVGLITRSDVIKAYDRAVLHKASTGGAAGGAAADVAGRT